MTLYTQGAPARPARHPPGRLRRRPDALAVSAGELQTAFGDEASHLTYVQKISAQIFRRPGGAGRPIPKPAAAPSTP